MMFTSLIQGVPMDAQGNVWAGFNVVVNIFSVIGGLAVTYLSLIHGLHFLSLRTKNSLHNRAINMADKLYWLLYPILILFVVFSIFKTDFYEKHFFSSLLIVLIIVLLTLWGHLSIHFNHNGRAFLPADSVLCLLLLLFLTGFFLGL